MGGERGGGGMKGKEVVDGEGKGGVFVESEGGGV